MSNPIRDVSDRGVTGNTVDSFRIRRRGLNRLRRCAELSGRRRFGIGGEEEGPDRIDQGTERFRRIDGCPQARTALETLRVIRPERADLVDDPAIVSARARFVDAL